MSAQPTNDELIRQANEQLEDSGGYSNPFSKFGNAVEDTDLTRVASALFRESAANSVESKGSSSSSRKGPTDTPASPSTVRAPSPRAQPVGGTDVDADAESDSSSDSDSESEDEEADQEPPKVDKGKGKQLAGSESTSTRSETTAIPSISSSGEVGKPTTSDARQEVVIVEPGKIDTSVRSGGVTSPPPSDNASVAGLSIRARVEEDLQNTDSEHDDPEDLATLIESKQKVVKPEVPQKSASKKPTRDVRKSVQSKAQAGSKGSGVPINEERLTVLEKALADLLDKNATLETKVNVLVDELSSSNKIIKSLESKLDSTRTELIMEINAKTKRVGGPSIQPTIVKPVTNVVPTGSVSSAPPNVIPSSSVDNSVRQSTVTPAPAGLTGPALRRYLARTQN